MSQVSLVDLIKNRRTRKPITYTSSVPTSLVTNLIDTARYAPNHHRTEPARFYLLNREKILKLAKLFGETIRGHEKESSRVERAQKKEREWSHATGLLVITSYSDHNSILVRKNPQVIEENFATTCCIIQNLLLLFENLNIAAKWSTAEVWQHPEFARTVEIKSPSAEKLVGFIFYGYSEMPPTIRNLSPLSDHLIDFTNNPEDFDLGKVS